MIFLALSLLLPAASRADDFCTALPTLHAHVFFCEDNPAYAKYAESCKEQFRSLAQKKSEELRQVLAGDLGAAAGEAQNTHFKTTQVSYESTDRTLVQTINIGRHARAEVAAYGDDFVAPFSWPWMDLGPFPGLHASAVQELFRSVGCYKDNIESIERTEAELDQMIHDLETTRSVAAQLHRSANGREGRLSDLSALPLVGARGLSGTSQNGASDVTGTGQKDASLVSGRPKGALPVPKLQSAGVSDITSAASRGLASTASFRSRGSLQSEAAMVRAFTPNLNPAPGQNPVDEDPLEGARSVGDAIWSEDAKKKLALEGEPGSLTEPGATAGASAGAAEPASSSLATVVAARDRDIFALVHDRYRAFERAGRP